MQEFISPINVAKVTLRYFPTFKVRNNFSKELLNSSGLKIRSDPIKI